MIIAREKKGEEIHGTLVVLYGGIWFEIRRGVFAKTTVHVLC